MWLVFPAFFEGPATRYDSRMYDIAFEHRMLNPMHTQLPVNLLSSIRFLFNLAPPIVALVFVLRWMRSKIEKDKAIAVFFFLLIYISFVIALFQYRYTAFLHLAMAIPLGLAVASLRTVWKQILCFSLLLLPWLFFIVFNSINRDNWRKKDLCTYTPLVELDKQTPRTVLALTTYSPYILYYTHHSVLGGPVHRNKQGILDTYDILNNSPEESQVLFQKREIDILALCPDGINEKRFFMQEGSNPDSLYRRLLLEREPPPDWLVPMELPEGNGDWKIYQVDIDDGTGT